jgi:UPF0755 protein
MMFDIPTSASDAVPVRTHIKRYICSAAGIFVLTLILAGAFAISPPRNFPRNQPVIISQGASARTFTAELAQAHVIRSPMLFYVFARMSRLDRTLDPGVYEFAHPVWLPQVLWRVAHAEHGISAIRVTITEGMTRYDIANVLASKLPGFDATAFLNESSTSEGYLFPETYLFTPGTSPQDVVTRLRSQFDESTKPLAAHIAASHHSHAEIVTLASILEREAKTTEDMRIVSGILWNRLRIDMPLQVDAAFGYAHQQNGYTPTAADLASDSPYNTYRFRGLPPTPISNPGLTALQAALEPQQTTYLYYLSDTSGTMHYATTLTQHVKNKQRYLR